MRFVFVFTASVLLPFIVSCQFPGTGSVENLNERRTLEEAVSRLSRGSEIRGAFSEVEQEWLSGNCRVIPTGPGLRKAFTIGDSTWKEFVVVRIAGDTGHTLSLPDFTLLVVADPSADFSGLPKSAKIQSIDWMSIRDGNLVVVEWRTPSF